MTLPNDTHVSGTTTFATHLVGGKEYPVGMNANPDGHIMGSLPAFGLVIPPVAVGANKIYFDLFNNEANTTIILRKLFAIVATDVAVTGAVAVRLDAMRTSAVGTGGTAAAATSAAKNAASFYGLNSAISLPAGITARAIPTAGATDAQWLFPAYVFPEETNVASSIPQFSNLMPELAFDQAIELNTGQGLKVVQGTVASVGNVGFLAYFTVE